jgi:hypothetical protein
MGTSSSSAGPGSSTPLVPTWLEPAAGPDAPVDLTDPAQAPANPPPVAPAPSDAAMPPGAPVLPPVANRFRDARSNFSRFATSGGTDRRAFGRAVSDYVSTSSGGSRTAARRLAPSRSAASGLLGFLSDSRTSGTTEALRRLDLPGLVGRPIQDVFVALTDVLCPDGGSIDEGIARDAFIETIADVLEAGILDLATLTADQMLTIFEMFVARSIEGRLHNDIGTKAITFPASNAAVQSVQDQVHDFILGRVHDCVHGMRDQLTALQGPALDAIVNRVYIESFDLMQVMAEAMAQ